MNRIVWMIAIVATMSLGASRCEKVQRADDAGGIDPGPGDGDGDGDSPGDGDGDGDTPGDGDGDGDNPGDGDGDTPGDGDGDVGGVTCGPSTCAEGDVCCNESCGICTEPGGFCTEQFCGEPDPDPTPPTCGGFGGIECPGAGMCVDDPSDDCDPANGGADCGGVCECSAALVLCITGTWFNEDPDVCECIPLEDGGDPDPMAPACGGFAGFPCPGEGECVDDPSDDCDPDNGGADCGGLCECTVGPVIDCPQAFDDSPEVCACVPAGGDECGSVTCGEGQVCCNASCGICTAPDEACIQIACE